MQQSRFTEQKILEILQQGQAGLSVAERPAAKREVVGFWRERFGFSERRACGLIGIARATHRYRRRPDSNIELRTRLRGLAEDRRRSVIDAFTCCCVVKGMPSIANALSGSTARSSCRCEPREAS